MSTSLVELAQAYIQSEWPKRQARAQERLNQLNRKYGLGGDWRLIQPGPIAEACSIWIEETVQLARDLVEYILNRPEVRPLLTQADQGEHLRRFIADWMSEQEDASVVANVKAFMAARGIKGDQEIAIMRERAQWQLAQARKEILLKIYQATRPGARR
jgi:Xaa-Pro aminopeptidase